MKGVIQNFTSWCLTYDTHLNYTVRSYNTSFQRKKKVTTQTICCTWGETTIIYKFYQKKKKTIIYNCSLELDDKNSTAVCFDQIVVLKIGKKNSLKLN